MSPLAVATQYLNEELAAQQLKPLELSVECWHPEMKPKPVQPFLLHRLELIWLRWVLHMVKLKNDFEQYVANKRKNAVEQKKVELS